MAGIGAITLDAAGAVTAPSAMPFSLPTVETVRTHPYALAHFAPMPAEHGVLWADGISPIRHYVTSVLGTGLLAPSAAPTVTPTGTRATTRLDCSSGAIEDGDTVYLGSWGLGETLNGSVRFVTTLSASPFYSEVVRGASNTTALAALKTFLNQTGAEGVDYYTRYDLSGLMEGTTATSTDLTIRALAYGTAANAWVCVFTDVDGGDPNIRFELEGSNTASAVFAGGAAGTGTTPSGGTYQYAYTYVREDDGAESGLSPTAEADNGGGGKINLADLAASADTSVDYTRVYRTTVGGGLFYRVDEIDDNTTIYGDTLADSTITNFGATVFDARLHRSYRAGMPPSGRYVARFQGRWFTAGALLAATYSTGTAATTKGDETVTVSGGYPRTAWVGRTFQASTLSDTYTIMSVDEAAGTFELDRDYEGIDTDADATAYSGLSYTVKDLRDPYEVFWSEPGMPNNWAVTSSLKGVTSPDGRGVTGIYAAYESLIVFTRQNVWRLTGSDGLYQVHLVSDKCGCVSGHTVVMDAGRMFWLGADGVYAWDGNGEPTNITTPPGQAEQVRGQDDTIARLSLGHVHRAVAVNDQQEGELRFYVPLDGGRTNRHALVFDLQNGGFALDDCEDITAAWVLQGPDGEDHAFTGDITGAVYEEGLSTSDVVYGIEQVVTVASSTVRSATASGTPFSTTSNGYWGAPVWHVSADGTFTRNCVATNTSSALTYRRFMTAPTATTQMVLGGILLWAQTGRYDYGDRRQEKVVSGITVSHSPESDGQYFFFSAYGQGDFAIPTVGWTAGDLTVGNTANDFGPRRRFRVRKGAVLHGWGICCIEPGCEPAFAGVTHEVRTRQPMDI